MFFSPVRTALMSLLVMGSFVQTANYANAQEAYVPGPVITLHIWLGDQCSFVPDLDVGECCVVHDMAYQAGGSEWDRYRADIAFRNCIRAHNRPIVAAIYYAGARLFGWLFFNYV